MIEGNDLLEEVIISANRRAEKVQDAPASISLITILTSSALSATLFKLVGETETNTTTLLMPIRI